MRETIKMGGSLNLGSVFILGLDGGTWNLLDHLIDQGYMPNLKSLCKNGVKGSLESTLPPYTAPAWVSSLTGMNPGKHGIFGFTKIANNGTDRTLISSRDIKTPRIWKYLGEAGKTAGLINVPVTYPAAPLNGFMIPGFLTPKGKVDYTYPATLYKELIKEIGHYVINVGIGNRTIDTEENFNEFIDEIIFCTRKRFQAMRVLWQKYDPNFFMIVFNCLDKIQHKFWKYMDPESSLYHSPPAQKARPRLYDVYRFVDEIIGYILTTMDQRTTLYLISDHGFGPLEKRVYLNKWLAREGFLSLKRGRLYLNKLIHRTGLKRINSPKKSVSISDNLRDAADKYIDYGKSLFFCSDVYEQAIYFNHRRQYGHEADISYERERGSLKEKILALKDVDKETPLVDSVWFKEEAYWGPHVNQAPDLLLKMKDYAYLMHKSVPLHGESFLGEVKGPLGCHRSKGIFAAFGDAISQHNDISASILDITPTILYNLGIPIPQEMDGRILKDIFTLAFQNKTTVTYRGEECAQVLPKGNHTEYSIQEEEEIRERLKDLGYLD